MQIGYLGLGKMGQNMVLRLLEQDVEVVAWNRSPEPRQVVAAKGAVVVKTVAEVASHLDAPRILWLMLPSGQVTDDILQELLPTLMAGDLVIDGGNALYTDTLRRAKMVAEKQIHYMDIGTSGGPNGARQGACLMIGGEREDFARIEPMLRKIAAEGAYEYLGSVGAGHFAKMVHNGIEYGMMEALAEGAAVLEKSQFEYDLAQVFNLYNKRSVIESRLVGWAQNAFVQDPKLNEISSQISHTGEGAWTIDAAKTLGVAVPVIEQSLQVRIDSAQAPENFRNKVVSALRGQFGGHAVTKTEDHG